jgi:hypothetical protein
MKKSLALMILIVLFLSGITAQAVDWPSLLGTWKGPFSYVDSEEGYGSVSIKMVVQDQQGPLFQGYFVGGDPGSTNWFSGSLQTSLVVTKGYDVTLAVTEGGQYWIAHATALLTTSATPWTLTRFEMTGFNKSIGSHGNGRLMARGSLTKK